MSLTIDDTDTWIFSPVCTLCKHWVGEPGVRKCKAFSKIPAEIWAGQNPHTMPYPGDKGIQFEKYIEPID